MGRQDNSRKAGLLVGWSVTQGEEGARPLRAPAPSHKPGCGRAGQGWGRLQELGKLQRAVPSFPVCPSPDDLRHEVWSP